MKNLPFEWLLKGLIGLILLVFIASCNVPAYAYGVHQKADELALVGYNLQGVQLNRVIVRNISMRSHFMVKLERDMLACAGNLVVLSTNPFQLCHHHLVVIGKASYKLQGAQFIVPISSDYANKKAVTL
ncbi:hypothetical protein [Acinetobacter sp. B51(2017)]|uniref:hypothetical protein n=1 Tax=Acinetobacter sp. B51(2017) TaxID=2060938 RepID=UPI000F097CDC|nr:hypothetical protein [Acinetobacter sp. B51(2017)]